MYICGWVGVLCVCMYGVGFICMCVVCDCMYVFVGDCICIHVGVIGDCV